MIINVTNSGSGAYIIDGVNNPALTVIRGRIYTFQINAVGHPFRLQTTAGAYDPSKQYLYADGGIQVGSIEFVVRPSTAIDLSGGLETPNTLYYVCQNHPSMGGIINVVEEGSAIEALISTVNLQLAAGTPSTSIISYGVEILAPKINLQIDGRIPYILRACVLVPPVPEPEPEPENVISTPTPPGVTYENLPVIDTVTQIIDTSPEEIIGCANLLITGSEQTILNSLFPVASDGDGVVNRGNNDIWTYNGSIWTNVGPTPGRQLVVTQLIPAYDEIEVLTALIRVKSSVEAINYSLVPIVVEPTTVVKVKATTSPVIPIYTSSLGVFSLESFTPSIQLPDQGTILNVTFGKCAYVIDYKGGGINTSKSLPTPLSSNMVFFLKRDTGQNVNYVKPWFDIPRGGNSYWSLDSSQDVSTPGMLQFNSKDITISSSSVFANYSLLNELNIDYRAYVFLGSTTGEVNNDGAIASTVYTGPAFSIISYTGTGAATTVGHGLGVEPEVVFFRRVSSSYQTFFMAGRVVGANYEVAVTEDDAVTRQAETQGMTGYSDSILALGTNGSYNALGAQYISYAFKNVEGVCKIGTFYGNQLPTGKFIDCGFKVNMVMIDALVEGADDIGYGSFSILDSSASTDAPIYTIDGSDLASSSPSYEFTEEGFRVYEVPGASSTSFRKTLNKRGVQYIFIAFAEYNFTKIACPLTEFNNQGRPPQVSIGRTIAVPVLEAYNLTGVEPSYVGVSLYALSPPRVNIIVQALAPAISIGVKIALNLVDFIFRKTQVNYVGESTEIGREYIAVVGDRDGVPLERSLRACVHSLVKDLKDRSLLDKFVTIVPMCLARTIEGASTPLIGRYPSIADRVSFGTFNSASEWIDYNRRTGARPYRFDERSWSQTSVYQAEIEPLDSHMATYITEENTAGAIPGELMGGSPKTFGGQLLGSNHTPQEFGMFRTGNGSSGGTGPSFTINSWGNATTGRVVTDAPHWSEPSLVGMSRNALNNYTIRVAKTNRNVITAGIVESIVNVEMSIFRYGELGFNGLMGDFRIPFYTIGKAVDLQELENVIETFLARVAAALPNAIIAAPAATLEVAGFAPEIRTTIKVFASAIQLTLGTLNPVYAGIPKTVVRCPDSSIELLVRPPSIDAARYLAPAANLGVGLLLDGGVGSALGGRLVDIVQVGTAAPRLGAAATIAYDGWTRILNEYSDDNFVETSTWPFTFTIGSTGYTSAFVAANTYITFGSGSTSYSGLSAITPPLDKIHFGAADNAMQKVYTQTGTVQGRLVQRIRYEGSASRSSSAVSSIMAEFTFFEPFADGQQLIELRFGNHDRLTSPFMIATVGTAYATATVVANTSWVFIGNSTGTAWTMTSGRYAA